MRICVPRVHNLFVDREGTSCASSKETKSSRQERGRKTAFFSQISHFFFCTRSVFFFAIQDDQDLGDRARKPSPGPPAVASSETTGPRINRGRKRTATTPQVCYIYIYLMIFFCLCMPQRVFFILHACAQADAFEDNSSAHGDVADNDDGDASFDPINEDDDDADDDDDDDADDDVADDDDDADDDAGAAADDDDDDHDGTARARVAGHGRTVAPATGSNASTRTVAEKNLANGSLELPSLTSEDLVKWEHILAKPPVKVHKDQTPFNSNWSKTSIEKAAALVDPRLVINKGYMAVLKAAEVIFSVCDFELVGGKKTMIPLKWRDQANKEFLCSALRKKLNQSRNAQLALWKKMPEEVYV